MRKTATMLASMATAILLAGGVGGIAAMQPAEAAFPGKNGKIAFHSNRDAGAGEIYTMKPDGTGVTRLTSPNGGNGDPAFSPDGTKIAFTSPSRSNYEISVMNADGTGRAQITNTDVVEGEPTWSPDGQKIAFVASNEIWAMNADGTNRTQLTSNTFPDTQPAWSPDGTRIAFVSARTGDTNRNVYVMNSDGTGQTSITPNVTDPLYQGHDDAPAWSPNGTKIAYVHSQESGGGGVPNIWTMDPDGANKANLSNSTTSGSEPAWSPDGTKLVYVGVASGTTNRDIWIIGSDGTEPKVLHANAAHDIAPDWQQDSLPPETSMTSGPLGIVRSNSASFAFSSSETGSTFQCSLDGAAFTACASPANYTVADGSHTFRVQARDVAGNVDATPAVRGWTADITKPTVSGMSPRHRSITSDITPSIRAVVRDNVTNLQKANVKLYVNGKRMTKFSYSAATDKLVYNSPKIAKGKKTVKIVANDAAGNVRTTSWYFTIK